MSNIKKPTGLSITRTGTKFKASWKKGDSYSAMQCAWGYHTPNSIVAGKIVSVSHTYSVKTFNGPITFVWFGVRGKKNGKWSDWAEKSVRIYVPKTPDVSAEFIQTAKTTFTWNPVTDNHERPITNAIVQTILVKDCPDGRDAIASLPEWSDENNMTEYTRNESGSITPVDGEGEDTGLLSGKSYTRIVRVKEVGIGGESGWGYAKHIYAAPYPATNIRGTVRKTEASLNCEMYWETPTDAGHPIDEDGVVPQYSIATPAAGMTCPDDASFDPLPPQGSTEGTEGKTFTIDTSIVIDKALFLRVTTQHDTDIVQSNAVLAGGDSVGALKLPAFTEAPAITATTVTVKATNESEVEDSFIVDYLERADGSLEILGLHDTPTKVYQVSDIENARVGIKAYVGEWNSILKTVNNIQMESAMLWSAGNVPVAPSVDDFDVEQSTVANTVLVGWKYSWDDADACEVSWSTEPDAWMSTEDPEYYVVLRGLENKLAIKGVDPGEPLYVRIRYMKGFDDDAILSPYSDVKSVIISTVPAIPTLTLEKQYYTKDEDITCSWVYITTDGTEQAHAQIAEQIVTTVGGTTNVTYDPILDVDTEQRAVLKNKWPVGTQHALAVRVANSSGNWSEWSEAVVITIAEPVECHITEHTLEYDTVPVNPETRTGSLVTLNGGDETNVRDVTSLKVALEPVQDNKYDSVWAGGAGKNKLAPYMTNGSRNGITYTANEDGTFTANGTATDNSQILSGYFSLPVGTYILSGCPIGGATSGTYYYRVLIYNDSTIVDVATDTGSGATFTVADASYQLRVFNNIATGYTANNLMFRPMIRLSTESADFEPYENIVPIIGHDSADVNITNVNQWDEEWEVGAYNPDNGNKVNSSTTIRTANKIPLIAGATYYVKTATTMNVRWFFYDRNGAYLRTALYGTNQNCTFPSDARYATFHLTATTYNNDISINYPSTDHDYHAYTGSTHIATLGQTVYGGTVDVVSGVLTVTHGIITNSGTGSWGRNADGSFYIWVPEASGAEQAPDGACNYCPYALTFDGFNAFVRPATSTIQLGKGWGDVYATVDELKSAFASEPFQIVYPLAEPQTYTLTAQQIALLTGTNNVWSEQGDITIKTADAVEYGYYLRDMPLRVTVTGAGAAGRTVLMIERTDDYRIERPEGEDFRGNVGEVVWQKAFSGEGQQEIILDDLQGHLDDGAKYRIYALVYDEYGQDDDDEIPFIVNWRHKATKPNATVDVTDIAKITIAQSALAEEGDYVDIYRRSIDGAELIYTGAEFGETYVDPYPTIGNFGYLIVGRSMYGDYVMEEAEEDYGQLAWRSVPAEYSSEKTLIDFNGDRIELYYNVDVSHSWTKDFKKTKYLGGSIVGDYVAGVERTASINFVSIPMIEEDMLESMRRLAEYEGEVHIRTREGSSFTACVQVNEDDNHDKAGFVRSFSMTVDKVDPVRLDGMTEAEWEEQNAVE